MKICFSLKVGYYIVDLYISVFLINLLIEYTYLHGTKHQKIYYLLNNCAVFVKFIKKIVDRFRADYTIAWNKWMW